MYSITSMLSMALQPALTTGYAIGTILYYNNTTWGAAQGVVYHCKGAWQLRG